MSGNPGAGPTGMPGPDPDYGRPGPTGPTPPGPGWNEPPAPGQNPQPWSGPTQPEYPPPAPPPSKRGQYIRYGILAVIAIAIIGGFILFRDRFSNDVTSLAAGECFDRPTASEVTEVQRQPCNEAHDAEVVASLTHPAAAGDAYPVVSGFDDYILENCVPLVEAYIGRDWETAVDLELGYFRPTLTGWSDGDRGFTCYLTRTDGAKLTNTLRVAGGASPSP